MSTSKKYLVSAGWMLLVVVSLLYVVKQVSVVSDMQQFLPTASADKNLQLLMTEMQSGPAASILLVKLSGAEPAQLAKISRQLKTELQTSQRVSSVENGEHRGLLEKYQPLMKYRYLLAGPADFSVEALAEDFKNIVTLVRAGASREMIKYLLADPQKLLFNHLAGNKAQQSLNTFHGTWFNNDKNAALLAVTTRSEGFDLDTFEQVIHEITAAVKQYDTKGKVKITVTGPGAIAVASRDAMKKTTQQVSWVMTGFILLVFWFAYRSIILAIVAGLPLLTSILVATALTHLLFGQLHGIVLAFGVTLLGVSLDYPLHLFSHLSRSETVNQSLKKIWPTLKLGVLTSIVAYLGLIGTGFTGLNQLAVFASAGLLTALLVTRWLLPCWVKVDWIARRPVPALQPLALKKKLFITSVVIVLPLVIILQASDPWSSSMQDISPASQTARQQDRQLRQQLQVADVSHLFMTRADSQQKVLEQTEQLKARLSGAIEQHVISGVVAVTDILPSMRSQQRYQQALPAKDVIEKNTRQALAGSQLKASLLEGFISDVEQTRTQPAVQYQDLLNSPLAARLAGMLMEHDGQWLSMVRVTGVKDNQQFSAWLEKHPDLRKEYFSMGDSTGQLMKDYLQVSSQRLYAVLVLVMLLVAWQSRTRRQALWVMVPVLAGVLCALALQVLIGNKINLFHVLSLLLVIGMGLDYSLFFNRDWQQNSQLESSTHAIMVSVATTVVAFGVLSMSDIPVLKAIGQTVCSGILASFIVAQLVAVPEPTAGNKT